MLGLISGIISGGLTSLFGVFGKTITDIHTSNTARQGNENQSGVTAHSTQIAGITAAGAQRADVQKSQGSWGPFGIAGFIIALAFAYHTVMIVLDSTSWHLVPVMKFYIIPWLEWQWHQVGTWRVAALPGKWEETEHAILQALFYVGPPSAAIAIAAKAFRR
jgi:hypothetical protein